ncbi:probable disease resistance protein At4g27220 [Neltuma alba]|uniref:probable disease resistance protein At4g27220 n=1 Tax=Neltuma alba TaxID=207710 RepID=UPI0010A580D4|nr:probable disease resistance protein At4g27220 [Prosopis alba]
MQHLVDEEYRNSKDTTKNVSKWLNEANAIITENDKFWQDEHLPYIVCYLPKPWIRYCLAKKVYRLSKKVNNLCKTSFPDGVSSGLRLMSIDFLSHVINFESFNSRKQVTKDISKVLKDPIIKLVGVYGTGGVAKTTLVKKEASGARKDKLFDVVIFATVTRNLDIKEIQGQLADQLGTGLNEETESGRANRLRDIFKREKENTLVALDDLWAELDLNKLGIPIDDVNLTPNSARQEGTIIDGQATNNSKILKILLTSRSKEMVFDKMHVKENSDFVTEGLMDQEAEDLFTNMQSSQLGRQLRTKGYLQWEETLGQLERQEFTEVAESVDFSTKLSFEYLETAELKSTFLLCAQLGYHSLIMDLVKYCIGVDIFEGFLTVKKTREKVLRLIKKLKDSSMLLDSYSDDHFHMHDMLRESALSILYEEWHFFTMRNGELKEWPHKDEFEKYNGISICYCDINDELPNFICLPNAIVPPRNLFLNKLDCYKIVIGDFETFSMWDFNMPDCKFMKTIVPKEEHDVKINNFQKLRSLALIHLYNFTGVYSNDQGLNDDIILFTEQVEIPSLESFELSSMPLKM